MKWGGMCLIGLLALPVYSMASASHMDFVATKKVDENRMFLYRCQNTGNVVEVEQHYNGQSGREEVRFIVNGLSGAWITEGLNSHIWNQNASAACAQSKTRYISAAVQ